MSVFWDFITSLELTRVIPQFQSICKSKRASRDVSEEGVHAQEELSVSVRVGPASGNCFKCKPYADPEISRDFNQYHAFKI